jgi:general secretion pathway protein G
MKPPAHPIAARSALPTTLVHALRKRARRRGVTLVEVLIVVAIMALISGGVGFFVLPKYRQAQRDTAATTAKTIRQAASMWRSLKGGPGECPTVSKLIEDKEIDPSSTTQDPWGSPFVLTCTEDDVTVASAGPDGKAGTKDDVVVGPQGTATGAEE